MRDTLLRPDFFSSSAALDDAGAVNGVLPPRFFAAGDEVTPTTSTETQPNKDQLQNIDN